MAVNADLLKFSSACLHSSSAIPISLLKSVMEVSDGFFVDSVDIDTSVSCIG